MKSSFVRETQEISLLAIKHLQRFRFQRHVQYERFVRYQHGNVNWVMTRENSNLEDNTTVEGQAWLGTVPTDEFVNGMRVRFLRTCAASELRTAFFDCSKSGRRSIVFARERLLVFFRRPILGASCAAFSMVIHSEADGLEPGFWPVVDTIPST